MKSGPQKRNGSSNAVPQSFRLHLRPLKAGAPCVPRCSLFRLQHFKDLQNVLPFCRSVCNDKFVNVVLVRGEVSMCSLISRTTIQGEQS